MKIKATGETKEVILEMEKGDSALPPIPVRELNLKTILVPVDFSVSSRKAVEYAAGFARQFNSEIMLLHILEPPPPQVDIMNAALLDTDQRQEAADHLSLWRKEVNPLLTVKPVLRSGSPAHVEIVKAAEEVNADLIILGNRGRTGLARVVLGSTAESVVRHAPCPVLVIREHEHDFVPGLEQKVKAPKP